MPPMMSPSVQAGVTLANSVLGVTIIALPYCFSECGIVLATALLILVAMATVKSSELLLRAAHAAGASGYEQLAGKLFGHSGKLVAELGLTGLSLGSLVAYFAIAGDLLPATVPALAPWSNADAQPARYRAMLLFALFAALPLSLMRNVTYLAKASAVSLALYAALMLHMWWLTLTAAVTDIEMKEQRNPYNASLRLLRTEGLLFTLPIVCLAFACQSQLFLMLDSLGDATLPLLLQILKPAIYSSCLFYWMIGCLGYVAFSYSRPVILGDIMAMYPDTAGSNAIRLMFVASIAVTFPVVVYPCRVSMHSLVYEAEGETQPPMQAAQLLSNSGVMPAGRFNCITVGIIAFALTASILSPNVEFILGITGAITGSVICYILPAACYLRAEGAAGIGRGLAAKALLLAGLLLLAASGAALLAVKPHVTTSSAAEAPAVAAAAAQPDPLALAPHEPRRQQVELAQDSQSLRRSTQSLPRSIRSVSRSTLSFSRSTQNLPRSTEDLPRSKQRLHRSARLVTTRANSDKSLSWFPSKSLEPLQLSATRNDWRKLGHLYRRRRHE